MIHTRIFKSIYECNNGHFLKCRMFRKFIWKIYLSLSIILIIYTLRCIPNRKLLVMDYINKRSYQDSSTCIQNPARAFTQYQNEEFNVISDLVTPPGDTSVNVHQADVSVCSQTSVGNLFYIVALAEAWDGPISMAVFTYDDRVDVTLDYILLLRRCSPEVRQRTSFHLVAPVGRATETLNVRLEPTIDCGLLEGWKTMFAEENYALKGAEYPVNYLRNVALTHARTSYVINLDIDLLPSYGLHAEIVSFLSKLDEQEQLRKTLYVLPSFESKSSNGKMSKRELIEANKQGTVRQFSIERCLSCQARTKYKTWFSLPYPSEMSVAYFAKYHYPYEPYYIAPKKTLPFFDGRFKQYGFNRVSQVCEAYVAGFDVAVLNNAFVTHDGFREHISVAKNTSNQDNLNLFKNVFIPELRDKYPESNRTC